MRKILGVIGLLCCCMAVGCGFGTEGTQPTVAASVTGTVTVTEVPSPTPVSEGVPIDEEHFGDTRFCELLKEWYDKDGDGMFSAEELTAVETISLAYRHPFMELKGFSYFTSLETLILTSVDRVEIIDVPRLKEIRVSGEIKNIGIFVLKNCPLLETVYFPDMQIGQGVGEEDNLVIENCPKLSLLEFDGCNLEGMKGQISGTPNLEVQIGGWKISEPERLVMDSEVRLKSKFLYDIENNRRMDSENSPFVWRSGESQVQLAAWNALRDQIEEIKEGFYVQMEESIPARYNEEGNSKAYLFLEHPRLTPNAYGWEEDWRNNWIDCGQWYKGAEEEEYFFVWKNEEYSTRVFSHASGVRGVYSGQLEVMKRSEEGEVSVGVFEMGLGFAFNESGNVKLCRYYDVFYDYDFDAIDSAEIWKEQVTSEYVEPAEGDIPIDKEHFPSAFYRRFVRNLFDLDGNGYLSMGEREAVTDICLCDMEMEGETLDCFEWFPNLEEICLPSCEGMVIRNCPNLVSVGAGEGNGANKLIIENCPKLEELYFTYAGVMNLYVKDCESFRYISDYCSWDVSSYDTVWEFVNCPKLIITSDFGKRLIADANEVSVCFAGLWQPELSYKDGMFFLEGREHIEWKNLPEGWFLPSEELLAEKFVTDALKANLGVEDLSIDYYELLVYSPGKVADYQVDVVFGNAVQEDENMPWKRCCIWITPEKEVVFYDSYETWNEERMPGWSQWY